MKYSDRALSYFIAVIIVNAHLQEAHLYAQTPTKLLQKCFAFVS